jgi:hypothetical protein
MAYKIETASLTDGVIILVLSSVEGLEVGTCVRIYRTGQPRIDGRRNLLTVDTETDTVTIDGSAGANIPEFEPANASLVPLVTWVDDEDVELFLGLDLDPESDDAGYLATVTEAANDWAYRRRASAGYTDSRCIIPNPSAKEGTVLYAGALWRERGSIDSFQSFQDQPLVAPIGSMGQIMRLLGIGKPAIG